MENDLVPGVDFGLGPGGLFLLLLVESVQLANRVIEIVLESGVATILLFLALDVVLLQLRANLEFK